MNRLPLVVISLLSLAACQSRPAYAPEIIGHNPFRVGFHGELRTAPEPLEPTAGRDPEPAPDCAAGAAEELEVRVEVLSVPRARLRSTLAVQRTPRPTSRSDGTRTENARAIEPPAGTGTGADVMQLLSFTFRGQVLMPIFWWGPQGMRVPAADARQAFDRLRRSSDDDQHPARSTPFRQATRFRCDLGRRARVASTSQRAHVQSFRFSDDRNVLQWEPIIATAEHGIAVAMQPELTGDALHLDLRLQVRDIVGMPMAGGKVADAYAHSLYAPVKPVTVEAPLFGDHVFEVDQTFGRDDAFVLFATNTVKDDEILLALVELNVVPKVARPE